MARQGSRCQPKHHHRSAWDFWTSFSSRVLVTSLFASAFLFLGVKLLAIHDVSASESTVIPTVNPSKIEQSDLADIWFRVQWSSEEPNEWHVRLKIDSEKNSEFLDFENHCSSDSSTGAFTFVSGKSEISIDTREPSSGGEIRVRVRAHPSAQLMCDLVSSGETHRSTQVAISDLLLTTAALEKTTEATPPFPKLKWTFERTIDDSLRVDLGQASSLVPVGEPLKFSLAVNHLRRFAGTNVNLRYSLRRVDNVETVSSQSWSLTLDEFGSAVPIDVTSAALTVPGVYELRGIIETTDDGIWRKFRRNKETVAESGVAFLVVDKNAKVAEPSASTSQWREIQTIRFSDSDQWSWSSFVPATTDALLSKIQSTPKPSIASSEHAGQVVSMLNPNGIAEITLPVDRVGAPHLVSIRYPSRLRSQFRIDLLTIAAPQQPCKSFTINETAVSVDRSPWSTRSFVYYPSGRNDKLRLTNLDSERSASIHSIRVSAGPETLAESISSSDGEKTVALSLSDFGWVEHLTTDFDSRGDITTWLPETKSLYRLTIAATRLADYVRAIGMNSVVIPANQGGRTWFATSQLSRCCVRPGESSEQLAVVLHTLDATGLAVLVGLDPAMTLTPLEAEVRQNSLKGKASQRNAQPNRMAHFYHPLDESVQSSTNKLLDDLIQVCGEHACFKGVSLNCAANSYLSPVTANDRLDVMLFERFAKSRPELKLSFESPEAIRRFERWRIGEGRSEFDTWLLSEQRHYFEQMARRVGRMVLLRLPLGHVRLEGEGGLCTASWPIESSNLFPLVEYERASLGSLSKSSAATRRLNAIATLEPDHSRPLAVSVHDLEGPNELPSAVFEDTLSLDVSRIVDRVHPRVVLIDCGVVTGSISPLLASSLRSIAVSEMTKMTRVLSRDPSAQAVHLYQHASSGSVLAINFAPWVSEIEIMTYGDVTWAPETTLSSLANELSRAGVEPNVVAPATSKIIPIAAGEVKWIRHSGNAPVRIVDWTSRPVGGEAGLVKVKEAVTQVVERLGVFSEAPDYDVLANSGFEQPSAVGIVGWLAAQHPPDAVRVDSESIEGKQSLCLTTDTRVNARTWIVSDTIPVPPSGRLAVSLACRGELAQGDSIPNGEAIVERVVRKLRITLEGTRNSEPVRFASDIEIPADGRWQSRRIVLEVDGIDASNTDSLRLAIDSLTNGRIWIDDVHLHDRFPLESERNDLQSQSFLAIQGLQRGNIVPASRLLWEDWAQYLLSFEGQVPEAQLHQDELAPKPPAKGVTDNPSEVIPLTTEQEAPGIADRIRSWLPRRLRF